MNSQFQPQGARPRSNHQATRTTPPQGVGAVVAEKIGMGSASGAAFGVAVITTGLLMIGTTALVGAGVGAGAAALSEGDTKKGLKWGAGIGAGLGLLGWLPFAAMGTAVASNGA